MLQTYSSTDLEQITTVSCRWNGSALCPHKGRPVKHLPRSTEPTEHVSVYAWCGTLYYTGTLGDRALPLGALKLTTVLNCTTPFTLNLVAPARPQAIRCCSEGTARTRQPATSRTNCQIGWRHPSADFISPTTPTLHPHGLDPNQSEPERHGRFTTLNTRG